MRGANSCIIKSTGTCFHSCFHSARVYAASAVGAGMVWTGIFPGALSSAKPAAGVGHRFPDGQESGIR